MGPGGVNGGVVVFVTHQLVGQVAGVVGGEVDVDRQAEFDRAGADGHEGAQVAVGQIALALFDVATGVGGEDEIGLAEGGRQDRGEVDGAVQPLAVELAEAHVGFFCVTQKYQSLCAILGFGTHALAHGEPEHCRADQQDRQQEIGKTLQGVRRKG